MLNEIIAIVLGYLLGSIPSAYIAGRLAIGKDIRQIGGGNVGGLNVYREVGVFPAALVGIADLGKGAATVAIAYGWLDVSLPWVLAAAFASVLGHNWMLFLRFTGGKGMGPAIGAIAVLLPVYGHALGLAYFLGTILVLIIITRNVALAMGVALLALPFISWFGMHSLEFLIFTIVLGLTIAVRFFPTAMRAAARSKSAREFIFDRWQRHKQPPD